MTVYVYQIDRSTSEEDLLDLFEEFGEVSSVQLQGIDDLELETLSAEIVMAFEDDAQNAIEELNGERIDGRILQLSSSPKQLAKKAVEEELEEEAL